jgi:LPXTG-site transpeptidase (sortase) family protein
MKSNDLLDKLKKLGDRQLGDLTENQARTDRLLAAVQSEAGVRSSQARKLPKKWFRRPPTKLDQAINLAIALCFIVGIVLVLKTPYEYYMRQKTSSALINTLENGGFIEVPVDAYVIPGEAADSSVAVTEPTDTQPTTEASTTPETTPETTATAEPTPTGYTPPTTAAYKPPTVTIQAIGVNLRYGIGRYPPSAPIGEVGRTVLLGHKMKYYGVYFSRLYEMAVGDPFTITTAKSVYAYRVYKITSVYKDKLLNEVFAPCEGSQIMLVTCDFRFDSLGNDRFLVHAKLESTTPR